MWGIVFKSESQGRLDDNIGKIYPRKGGWDEWKYLRNFYKIIKINSVKYTKIEWNN